MKQFRLKIITQIKTIFLFASILPFVISCDSDILKIQEAEIKMLKTKITEDSLLLISSNEIIKEINFTIDSVFFLHTELKASKSISKNEALKKIRDINKVLNEKNLIINDLEEKMDEMQSSIPRGYVTETKKQIQLQLSYYNELKNELQNLKTEKINLSKLLEAKESELIAKDNIIQSLQKERNLEQIKLKELETNIIVAENDFQEAKQNTAETYYLLSNDLKNLADKTSGILAKNKKSDLINLAYEYYKKSYELGYNKSKLKINEMETDKKYYKYLTIN